jgi:hypothetical protein
MAEQVIVSPGVFTQERDLSFLPQGIAAIGAAFVGPTTEGPAFVPTLVDKDSFKNIFGVQDANSYLGYAVDNYLQEATSATVVRVLGLNGYSTNVVTLFATGSAGTKVLAVLHPTISGSLGSNTINSVTLAGTTASFSLLISSSTASGPHISASGLTVTEGTISNYFGTTAQGVGSNTTYPVYTYAEFANAIAQAGTSVTLSSSINTLDLTDDYSNATTPWIQSQPINGQTVNLFKIHTIADGTNANTKYKVSIQGVEPSVDPATQYGTFTLILRNIDDEDVGGATSVSDDTRWDGLTLDPNSPNYIARRIGNSVPTLDANTGEISYEGLYPNNSRYIRIEMAETTIPPTALPFGFAALRSIIATTDAKLASGSYITSRYLSASVSGYNPSNPVDANLYYGFDFRTSLSSPNTTNLSYLSATPVGYGTVGSAFTLNGLIDVPTTSAPFSRSINISASSDVDYRRFSVPFQSGFDGLNPARQIAMGSKITNSNTQGFNLSTALTSGSAAYVRALNQLKNPDTIDLNLLAIPGVIYRLHPYIATEAMNLCRNRGDCFYIMDIGAYDDTISDVTSLTAGIDTSYAASYYPWVKVLNPNSGELIWAPPSVVLPEVYQYNDNVGAEWFAPAGLNRGGIPGAIGVKTRLTQAQRDTLYRNRINPIAQFPGQGICVWGQKTLQIRSSALDRVNVRRLLITVKKFIASSARYLVFEQNTEATRNRFLNIVNPYLANIQQRSGLTAFRVIMDDTNNTPDLIDRNILVGAIYLQPTRTAEFIKLDFNILPTGATFDTI